MGGPPWVQPPLRRALPLLVPSVGFEPTLDGF